MCISAERRIVTTRRRRYENAHRQQSSSSSFSATPEQLLSSAQKDKLLQACLRYDWDQVEHWCTILATATSCCCSTAKNNNIDLVRQQLLQQDSWGNTALHAACHYNPPLRIVLAILKLAKTCNVRNTICTLGNANGAVPLVVACTTGGASLPVLLLLSKDLQSKQQLCDAKGNSAIGGLLDRYLMLRKVPKFAQHMLPLKDITSIPTCNNKRRVAPLQEEEEEELSSSNCCSMMMDDMAVGGFDQCWTKMELLLQVAWRLDHNNKSSLLDDWNPLHGAANVASQIPPELSELLIRCHREMVSKPTASGGLLPLHMAIDQGASIFVQQLIRADPSTASIPNPQTGELPLVQAIRNNNNGQFSWNVVHHHHHTNHTSLDHNEEEDNGENSIPQQQGILELLWRAFPEALENVDATTGLHPALLAATIIPNKSNQADQQQQQRQQLDNVFCMLRLNPSIVASS